mmetsp:Transcript_34447/g.34069  ORF Transcript_34447/g.34069 Transcript_34447/m.34069 type:complete len:120 (+) Transcript_34447:157-516(+)
MICQCGFMKVYMFTSPTTKAKKYNAILAMEKETAKTQHLRAQTWGSIFTMKYSNYEYSSYSLSLSCMSRLTSEETDLKVWTARMNKLTTLKDYQMETTTSKQGKRIKVRTTYKLSFTST